MKSKPVYGESFIKSIYSPKNFCRIPGLCIDHNPLNKKPSDAFLSDSFSDGRSVRTGLILKRTNNKFDDITNSLFIECKDSDFVPEEDNIALKVQRDLDYERMSKEAFWIKYGLD